MPELTIDALRKLCDSGKIKWTMHVAMRLQERLIFRDEAKTTKFLRSQVVKTRSSADSRAVFITKQSKPEQGFVQ